MNHSCTTVCGGTYHFHWQKICLHCSGIASASSCGPRTHHASVHPVPVDKAAVPQLRLRDPKLPSELLKKKVCHDGAQVVCAIKVVSCHGVQMYLVHVTQPVPWLLLLSDVLVAQFEVSSAYLCVV